MRLSETSQKILSVFFGHPGDQLYVNELIRKTGLYPNSVSQSLKTLEKQNILASVKKGRKKFYFVNDKHDHLEEIKSIVGVKKIQTGQGKWERLLGRKSAMVLAYAIQKAYLDYLKTLDIESEINHFWYNDVTSGVYLYPLEIRSVGQEIAKKLRNDIGFAREIIDKCRDSCRILINATEDITNLDLPNLTKKELSSLLKEIDHKYCNVTRFMLIPHAIERDLFNEVKNEIKKTLDKKGKKKKFKKYLEILTEPVSLEFEERKEALKVAAKFKKQGLTDEVKSLIQEHGNNYCWLPLFDNRAEPLSYEYFENQIELLAEKEANPLREISRIEKIEEKKEKALKKVFEKIEVDSHFRTIVNLLQKYIVLRTTRRDAIAKANYHILPLLHELAERMELDEAEVKLLCFDELLSWLKHGYGKKFGYRQETLEDEIDRRKQGWAVLFKNKRLTIISGITKIIEAIEQNQIIAETPSVKKRLKGNPACRGEIVGNVKIVTQLSELDKVEEGDILVAKMTTPDYMSAIGKAAGIVTDEGGVTCHAAIVSREFNIPCVVATKNATQILSDNDLVQVDANKGVIRVMESADYPQDIKEIFGKTIYEGKVRGKARIILDSSDFEKVKDGDILIAPQTTPEYLSSLYRVKGFVVDEESLTSHAALYGQALKLPSIMGTEFARNAIEDGELVELNATKGFLKRLKK